MWAWLLGAVCCRGAERGAAYGGDPNTLHLWHLDEKGPPFKDEGAYPKPLKGLLNGAKAGVPSADGLGTGVSFLYEKKEGAGSGKPYGPILLAMPALDQGPKDNVDDPFPIMGPDGSFTMEAVVKLDMLPNDSPGYAASIIMMDDDSPDGRVFLFRIEKPGLLTFTKMTGDFVTGGGTAVLPLRGPNAVNTKDWFHVAVTYDADDKNPGNLKLYWTRLGPGVKAANEIGRGTLSTPLSKRLGDFSIGNSGKANALGTFEFFPGTIDEVRMSAVPRKPFEFFFVSAEDQAYARDHQFSDPEHQIVDKLGLQKLVVDETPVQQPPESPLVLGPGSHRLDFEFGYPQESTAHPLSVKCKLEGLDEDWKEGAQGMSLSFETLDAQGSLLSRTSFPVSQTSPGWQGSIFSAPLIRHTELVFIPAATHSVRLTMSSGAPATRGCWILDVVTLTRSKDPRQNLWRHSYFGAGKRSDAVGGLPDGWERGGSAPGLAMMLFGSYQARCLGFLDGEADDQAEWTSTQTLDIPIPPEGEEFVLGWSEAYDIIPGPSLRASYNNLPAGNYTFRAIAMTDYQGYPTSSLGLPIVIRPPFWKRSWFPAAATAAAALLVGGGGFLGYRRRTRARIAAAQQANAIERNRARIARDVHDDLGTRGTLIIHGAQFIRDAIEEDPAGAKQQAERLVATSSNLVRAIDELVWTINPANDTLDDLADHLAGVAQEIFVGAAVVLRISIPTDFPPVQIHSDFRSQFSLAVKEALHNVLKHAGPCEASLEVKTEGGQLVALVSDNGRGFDPEHSDAGNGLANLVIRANELNGTCMIESAPNSGARVVLRCPLPDPALNVKT